MNDEPTLFTQDPPCSQGTQAQKTRSRIAAEAGTSAPTRVGLAHGPLAQRAREPWRAVAEPLARALVLGAGGAVGARACGAGGRAALDHVAPGGGVAEQVEVDAVQLKIRKRFQSELTVLLHIFYASTTLQDLHLLYACNL